MCDCATGLADCMTRPGVAELRCNSCGCCDASTLNIGDIALTTRTWFDNGATEGAEGETTNAAELALMADYRDAIEIAWDRLTSGVCMAAHAAQCTVTVEICGPTSSACCSAGAGRCGGGIYLPELAKHNAADRILTATLDGTDISVNGSIPDAASRLTTHNGYRLHGPAGTLVVQAKPMKAWFKHAVLSLACRLVPGVHGSDCAEGDDDTADRFGDPFADALDATCQAATTAVGRKTYVESAVWTAP